jgi:sphinganine-1-phosphate aldolase
MRSIHDIVAGTRPIARTHRVAKPHIERPEVLAPFSVHNVLTKAARYLDLTVVRAPLRDDLHADLDALESLIGPSTIAIMGSAPNLAFGYFDDIPQLGRLAIENDLWLHIDATIGGFLAPFMAANGEYVPPWDFAVPGVRSMSASFDKWAYAMKPAAVVAWRDLETKQHSLVTTDDWPLEPVTSTGIGGGRSGGPVAAAWAVFHHLGREGYRTLASHLTEGQREYARRLAAVPGITVVEPGCTVLNFVHESLPPDAILLAMHQRGWRQFACKTPPMVTLNFDAASVDVMEEYMGDLCDVIAELTDDTTVRTLRLVSPPER